jgi:hypothetical protein
MSKFMWVLGILLAAVGIAILFLALFNNAYLQVRGLQLSDAINLIIGAVLAIGLAGVISALQGGGGTVNADAGPVEVAIEPDPVAEVPAAVDAPTSAEEAPVAKPMRFPSFSRKVEAAAAAAPAAVVVAETVTETTEEIVTPAVKETISALEQAKSDLEAALASPEETAEAAQGELYVVEDKVVRGRPARILSDGTVEAETDEGWMRFENLEHLDEYLDAIEQA